MSLYSELRRRNVHRMAVLYLGAAWLIVQVVDLLIDRGPLPDSIGPVTLIVLAIGFPMALIISWFYELTAEGVSLDTDEEPAESAKGFSGRRVDFVIIAVLAAALVVFAYDKWWIGPPPERSVAVLRFVNMSAEEDSAYFSDGLADTMLHMLAQVPDLRVPARTSSFQPSLDGLDVAEIGKRLGVSTVLEGSVQRYGDKIRIIAQLIDATNGDHLWSRTFDRDFKDIFAIQDDIAREVVAALKVSMSDETAERLNYGGTDNTDAYTEYLLAIDSLNPMLSTSAEMALPHLQKAIEIDPDYALAHAILARLYLDKFGRLMGRSQATAAAKEAVNRALDIAPDLPEALAVLGRVEMFHGNRETGKQLLRKAIEVGPNNTLALTYYAFDLIFYELRPDEGLAISRRIIKLNPLQEDGYRWAITTLLNQGKMSEALELALRFREVMPDSPGAVKLIGDCYFWMGEYAAITRVFREILALDPGNTDMLRLIGVDYLLLDMVEEARHWFDREAEANPEGVGPSLAALRLNYYLQQNEEESFRLARKVVIEEPDVNFASAESGLPLIVLTEYGAKLGRNDSVLELLNNRYPHLFNGTPHDGWHRTRTSYYGALALLQSGDIKRGAPLMQAFLEYRDREEEHYVVEWHSIAGRLALGDTEATMTKLKQFRRTMYAAATSHVQIMFKYSALFDPIRDEPEFIALLDEYRKNAAEQRRLVQADETK